MSSFFNSSLSKKLVIRVNEIFVFIKADNTVGNTVSGNLNMLNNAIDTNAVFASKTFLESIKKLYSFWLKSHVGDFFAN